MGFLRPTTPPPLGLPPRILASPIVVGGLVLALFAVALTGCGSAEPVGADRTAADVVATSDDPDPQRGSGEPSQTPVQDPTPRPTAAAGEGAVDAERASDIPAATVAPTPTITAQPTEIPLRPAAPNGRRAPSLASTPTELAEQIAAADAALLDPSTDAAALSEWGHLHQVAIRKLGAEPAWDIDVFTALPPEIVERTILHVAARRALLELHSGYDAADFIPAWQIVEPEPRDDLLEHYRRAEEATGIDWEYLAAINLIETGMGRIRGLSSAGAQGPMQFLPTTWAEAGIGEGDINDPGDAIAAAARYLVRRGGPADMPGALWGYNNSDNYVSAVQSYAALLRDDPAAYTAIYHWEIYFSTDAGDVWLPTGFRTDEVLDLDAYLAAHPWSIPDPELAASASD